METVALENRPPSFEEVMNNYQNVSDLIDDLISGEGGNGHESGALQFANFLEHYGRIFEAGAAFVSIETIFSHIGIHSGAEAGPVSHTGRQYNAMLAAAREMAPVAGKAILPFVIAMLPKLVEAGIYGELMNTKEI